MIAEGRRAGAVRTVHRHRAQTPALDELPNFETCPEMTFSVIYQQQRSLPSKSSKFGEPGAVADITAQ